MPVTVADRRAVFARDGGRCAACGRTDCLTIQHRIDRQMGGSKFRDGFTFWLTLCLFCNDRLEQDAKFAAKGRSLGWKLRTTEKPAELAVYIAWQREWHLLDTAGNFKVVFGLGPHLGVTA